MRLGVAGIVSDFRKLNPQEIDTVKELQFTGISYHFASANIPQVSATECDQFRFLLEKEDLDLVQFGIVYSECLFDPNASVRQAAIEAVNCGMPIAKELGAFHYLFRPGSLNTDGAWTSHRDNYLPESMERLIETLKPIAEHAEQCGIDIGYGDTRSFNNGFT